MTFISVANLSPSDSRKLRTAGRSSLGRTTFRRVPCTLVLSATARANGTSRTASPAGGTWTCRRPARRRPAGREALREAGVEIDVAFTSVLTRAVRTLQPRLGGDGPAVGPRRAALAAQRAPLRRPHRPRQGGDQATPRRGAVHHWRRSYRPRLPRCGPGPNTTWPRTPATASPPDVVPSTECLADGWRGCSLIG